MGYIKKLKNNELVGGTDKTTIYPVTSTKAVFEEVTDGDKSSFKSQETINKEQQDELDDHEERIQAAEAEDIKSITINGSTKKFEVDDENNVDLTIYTVDSDPDMPDIADNVRDLRNMVGTSTPVLETSHKTRIETLEGGESVTGSVENKIKTKIDSINSSYQDDDNEYVKYSMTQTSGEVTDFNIDETNLKNAIASLNTSISGDNIVIRSGSTPSGTGEAGKIYRYVNSSNNTYTDYMYSGGSWVPLATHDTSNEQAQVAYYTCIATGSGAQAIKQFVGNGSLTYNPSSGGHIKILMGEANTATGTIYLKFGTTSATDSTKKPLYYNGEPSSANNTWEAGETIAVYYDPSANNNTGAYFASNAQGGGGKAEKISYNNSQSGLASQNVQGALDEVSDIILDTPTEYTNLVQGYISQAGVLDTNMQTRVSTGDFINAVENAISISIKNGYCIRTANKYDSTGTHIEQILNSADYTSYKFEKGYKYKVTFCNKSNPSTNITPSDLDDCVFIYTLPNKSMEELDDAISNNTIEISAINNLIEDTGHSGDTIPISLVQGVIDSHDTFVELSTRVTTNIIDATECGVILQVGGDYSIRNGNMYSADGTFIRQYLQADLLSEITLLGGYKYRMTICKTDDLSADITPEDVMPYVSAFATGKREIVVKVNNTSSRVDALEEQKRNEGNYLISDYFNENNYNLNNYSNFNAANLSSGHYNIASGWTNTLKMSKVVSFQDFTFEFDVNVTNNTEKIVVATEVTENVVASVYGSCAYIDMSAAKMYLLKPKLYNDSNSPNTPGSGNIVTQIALTNITSSSHRYIVSFGKKDRNLFVKFKNYYTNEIVELTCTDANNTSLAGSGYDKIRVGSMSGAISLNSIIGISKTNVDVLFVGDSITDGRNIPLADSWAYKFGEYLTDNYLIAARAGGQIQQVINLLNAYGQIISPKVIIASVGVNGGNTTDKFLELFNVIKSLNAIPVINTIYNVGSDFSNITEEEWNTMNSYILSLPCKHIRFDIASSADKYAPVFKELDSSYTLTDSVHPDSGGSELLYQRAVVDLNQLKSIF